MPAPRNLPACKAFAKASLSTTGPRAVLINTAVSFIISMRFASITWRVSSVNGTCKDRISASCTTVSRSVKVIPSAASSGFSERL